MDSSTQSPLNESLKIPTEPAVETATPGAASGQAQLPPINDGTDEFLSTEEMAAQEEYLAQMDKPLKEQVLFEWKAPSRPFKNRNRQYYTTVGMIGGLVALILIFAGQMLPVAVLLTVTFLLYILNTVPPGLITHKITTHGIRIENTLYYWVEMGRFWITEQHGQNIVNIEVDRFPFQLRILLAKEISVTGMVDVLSDMLINEKPAPTTYEKAAQWLHKKIPIDLDA